MEAEDIDWAVPQRTRLRADFLRVARRAGELMLAKAESHRVSGLATRMLEIDPLADGP